MNLVAALLLVTVWLGTSVLVPRVISMLRAGGAARWNYSGNRVATGGGAVFPLVLFPAAMLAMAFRLVASHDTVLFIMVLMGGWGVGVLDDWLGGTGPRGWPGHLGSLGRGSLSTGLVKLYLGGLLGLLTALLLGRSGAQLLADAALFALAMNSVNLLDLRPGRAIYYFVFALGATSFFRSGFSGEPLLLMCAVAALGYLPWDQSAKVMLGDSGANAIGAVLGLGLVAAEPAALRLPAGAALVAFQILGELVPISRALDGIWGFGGLRLKKRE